MVISRSEGAPWHGQRTPGLSIDLDAAGWSAVIALGGGWSQAVNQAQDVGEQASRNCDLGELERDIATVADAIYNLSDNMEDVIKRG